MKETPVFIKANSIFVTGDIYRGSSKLWKHVQAQSLSIHLFPGSEGQSRVFTYVDLLDVGQQKSMKLAWDDGSSRFTAPALTVPAIIEIRLDSRPKTLELNGETVGYEYQKQERLLFVKVPAGSEIDLSVEN